MIVLRACSPRFFFSDDLAQQSGGIYVQWHSMKMGMFKLSLEKDGHIQKNIRLRTSKKIIFSIVFSFDVGSHGKRAPNFSSG